MTKTVISVLLPFVAPFVLYAIWAWFMTRRKETLEEGKQLDWWQDWPWAILFSVGSVLAIIVLIWLFLLGDPPQEGEVRWVPPTVVDGTVVPGHYVPVEPKPEF